MSASSPVSPSPETQPTSLPEPYASQQLHATADSIRLVKIDPDLNSDGLIVCHLQTISLAQHPRYETLSYRWGDESGKRRIVVNGVPFDVTINLFEALHYFRAHARKSAIWIDAICINQTNVPERSSQLRIMPHIYSRASSTLVWLGGRYINLPINLGPDSDSDPEPNADIKDKIISDGYWDRVWILQEIGKAPQIHLCFGQEPAEWGRFIAWIRKHDDVDDNAGPLKLDHLINDRYGGSCSLRQLLINHATALCKDPRDKIYGLVGLSNDGRGFPMDYNKTLLEVWGDTIHFMSRNDLLPNDCDERIRFCRLVRDLLGGEELGSVSGVVNLYNNPNDESFFDSHTNTGTDDVALSAVSFFAEVYGVIVSLGPSASELISSLALTDTWDAELQRMYRGSLDSARFENDNLMRRIFASADASKLVNLTRFQNHKVIFHGPEIYGSYWQFMHRGTPPGLKGSWAHETTTPNEPRLAMLKISSTSWEQTPYKLAFVSPEALQGDFVCRIDGHAMKRVVVRPAEEPESNNVRMHICGTAITVRDVLAEEYFDDGNVDYSYKMDIMMDARTLYALIFGNEDEDGKLEKLLEQVEL